MALLLVIGERAVPGGDRVLRTTRGRRIGSWPRSLTGEPNQRQPIGEDRRIEGDGETEGAPTGAMAIAEPETEPAQAEESNQRRDQRHVAWHRPRCQRQMRPDR